jgi:hypothetical protein
MTEAEKLIEAAADPKVREACREACAGFGDPPCWELFNRGTLDVFDPCAECMLEAGYPPALEPRDDGAAIGDLL